ncbi:MAG: sugar phosphate isomerase/epimerase [Planctomycetota bacterium]|jgi:sugar phosphate isomerase/epimerase
MLFVHEATGRRLRLGYCMNLHPADTLDGVMDAMRAVTIPLAERLAEGEPFGVGMYFPASLAAELATNKTELERLAKFLKSAKLDPFTYNAFPAGGFGKTGLKERVFEPTWVETERFDFTSHVARIAAYLSKTTDFGSAASHVSISTHTGMHSSRIRGEADEALCAQSFERAARMLATLESEGAPRMVLSLEAEPRSNCNDTRELEGFMQRIRDVAAGSIEVLARHLGFCLDACHAAVEFESPAGAVRRATEKAPLGKLQFSSALSLPNPSKDAAARAALLSMDEPAYLHQVTGSLDGSSSRLQRAHDLPAFREALAEPNSEWSNCNEWRCHFHVPVDRAQPFENQSAGELGTTRAFADEVLDELLDPKTRWGTDELHVEIETYTWNLLAKETRGEGELIDGLQREYEHVLARLARAGWKKFSSTSSLK